MSSGSATERIVSADEAVCAIPDGARVVLPHGSVEPSSLYEALQRNRGRFRNLRLCSGMQFGDYPFLRAGLGENFSYSTWQSSPKIREHTRAGRVDFVPIRLRDVPRLLRRGERLSPDVVVVQTTPPRNGSVSLGISVSLYQDLIAEADLVLAEFNSNMPWTSGDSVVPVSAIDYAVESDLPLGTYRSPRRSERDLRIVEHVLGLIPEGAWVQLGVGAIPDAVLERLHEVGGVNLHSGMLTDGLIDFMTKARHQARVVTGEVSGGPKLYAFVAEHPRIEFHRSTRTHDLVEIAKLPKFVSVNSAIEIDLSGQVNGEAVDGLQLTGVGGSLDFVEGAQYSPGGVSILALPSTTEDGRRSKIVARFARGGVVTLPRFCADWIVTEFGAARMRGLSLRERAAGLIGIAHPEFRGGLEDEIAQAVD